MDKKAVLIGAGIAAVIFFTMAGITQHRSVFPLEGDVRSLVVIVPNLIAIYAAWHFGKWWALLGFFGALSLLALFVPTQRFDLILEAVR